jgi:hypothetical protein
LIVAEFLKMFDGLIAGVIIGEHLREEHAQCDLAPRSSGEEDSLPLETFLRNPAGSQSRPVELGQRPEASLAWWRATSTAKRRQRDQTPCD